ncbi:MAG TPA: DUF3185 domain-containing protein [Planctomycetota bacterium]|nr:DUF3185 domain-containing protein [Planctomycetota bacterium]
MAKSTAGLLLIVIGIVVALSYQGIAYMRREKVVDAGPIQVSVEKEKSIPIALIVGGGVLAAGMVLLVTSRRR